MIEEPKPSLSIVLQHPSGWETEIDISNLTTYQEIQKAIQYGCEELNAHVVCDYVLLQVEREEELMDS